MVRQVTAKDRYARAVAAVTAWCREHRHWSFRDQHRRLSSMMRGHFAYYGVGGNSRRLRWFANQVVRVWRMHSADNGHWWEPDRTSEFCATSEDCGKITPPRRQSDPFPRLGAIN